MNKNPSEKLTIEKVVNFILKMYPPQEEDPRKLASKKGGMDPSDPIPQSTEVNQESDFESEEPEILSKLPFLADEPYTALFEDHLQELTYYPTLTKTSDKKNPSLIHSVLICLKKDFIVMDETEQLKNIQCLHDKLHSHFNAMKKSTTNILNYFTKKDILTKIKNYDLDLLSAYLVTTIINNNILLIGDHEPIFIHSTKEVEYPTICLVKQEDEIFPISIGDSFFIPNEILTENGDDIQVLTFGKKKVITDETVFSDLKIKETSDQIDEEDSVSNSYQEKMYTEYEHDDQIVLEDSETEILLKGDTNKIFFKNDNVMKIKKKKTGNGKK